MKILDLDMKNPEKAISQISDALAEYGDKPVRVYIGRHFHAHTAEEKEANSQEKADKKAAATKAKEEKASKKAEKQQAKEEKLHAIATKQAEKDAAKLAKKAEKESEKEAVKKVAEKIEAAAQKAIDSKPTKKSHHNPAKGY